MSRNSFFDDPVINLKKGDIMNGDGGIIFGFGSIVDVGTTTTPITNSGLYQTPDTLQALELVSDHADDTFLGTGARTVAIVGIGPGWLKQTEVVAMDGLTPVPSLLTWYRVYQVAVVHTGTSPTSLLAANHGTILCRGTGAGPTWETIGFIDSTGVGTSESGMITIGAGKKALVMSYDLHVEVNKPAIISAIYRPGLNLAGPPYAAARLQPLVRHLNTEHAHKGRAPLGPFVGPCDLGFVGSAISGVTTISIEYELMVY